MKILTTTFFKENTQLFWQWHFDFLELLKNKQPNEGHHAINQYQTHLQKTDSSNRMMLVTQNIDNLHKIGQKTENGFTSGILELHGNVYYCHCSNDECPASADFQPTPDSVEEGVPRCKTCESLVRPHCMLFDENYSEKYYRVETILEYLKECDGIIVIGTALETSFASKLVDKCIIKELPIVEVNLEACIKAGNTVQLLRKSEEVLPELFEELTTFI